MTDLFNVARWEYIKTIKSKMFLFLTFGLPLLIVLFGGVIGFLSVRFDESAPVRRLGVEDRAGFVLSDLRSELADERYQLDAVITANGNEEEYRELIEQNDYRGILVIPEDINSKKSIIFFTEDLEGKVSERVQEIINEIIIDHRLQEQGYSAAEIFPIIEETEVVSRVIADEKAAADFLISMAMALLLAIIPVFTGSYVLQSIRKDKSNKVVEILFSSISSASLMYGKIVGYTFLGLTQMIIWVTASLFVITRFVEVPLSFLLRPDSFYLLLYFILGFFMVGCMNALAGAGTRGNQAGGDSSISNYIAIIPMIPLFVFHQIMEAPNGAFSRILSYIPFTSPITMIFRLGLGEVTRGTIVLTLLIIIIFIFILMKLADRLFKMAMLMYGQRISLKKILNIIITGF